MISKYHDVNGLIDNVTELLAASQSFMRTKKVLYYTCAFAITLMFTCTDIFIQGECSFVSLRDVERAMIVFEWFYENNDFFEQLLKAEQGFEVYTCVNNWIDIVKLLMTS